MPSAPSPTNSTSGENAAEQVKKLYADIEAAAKAREFSRAETLRKELMEASPSALTEIIGSAEIIEKEKTEALDKDHLAVWSHLYDELSAEERNGLFYSMKKIIIPPKKILLSHGAFNTRLFFIDSGKVTIIFPHKGKNTVLAQLGRGNLLGEYTFTSISLCSATAVSHTEVKMYCLENAATDNWDEAYPGLYEKINDFCLKNGSIEDIARWRKLEKRDKPRYTISGPVVGYLLNKEGKKTDSYLRGQLSDVSMEGCCFDITLTKKETARALLARQLQLAFSDKEKSEGGFNITSKIVKVSFHLHNDYSIHVNFERPVSKALLKKIVNRM